MAIMQEIETKLQKGISVSSNEEVYFALLDLVKEKAEGKVSNKGKKKLYYISAEFLIGKLLSNNLINLGIYDEVKETLAKNGKSLAEIEEVELEPSLGNGGLGRLAASDLTTTTDYSNRYLRTIFRKRLQTHGSQKRAGLQRQILHIR